ncbi:MAG: cupin domain-containing protein, partial [Candidatus Binatota bacterium]
MAKSAFKPQRTMWSKKFTYDYWMESVGVPVHKGFFVEDLRNVQLGWWKERQCMTAFIQLMGQEGVSSTRITEIPAGETTRPVKFSLDEV